jgi:hypothetical protein
MPIPDAPMSRSELFDDLRHGKTFSRTRKKHGKTKARKQMIAIVLGHERKYGRMKLHKRSRHKGNRK